MGLSIYIAPHQTWRSKTGRQTVKVHRIRSAPVDGGSEVRFEDKSGNIKTLNVCDFLEQFELVPAKQHKHGSNIKQVNTQEMKRLRDSRGWSYQQLAVVMCEHGHKVTRQALHLIEKGTNNASSETIEAMGRAFGVDPEVLEVPIAQ